MSLIVPVDLSLLWALLRQVGHEVTVSLEDAEQFDESRHGVMMVSGDNRTIIFRAFPDEETVPVVNPLTLPAPVDIPPDGPI